MDQLLDKNGKSSESLFPKSKNGQSSESYLSIYFPRSKINNLLDKIFWIKMANLLRVAALQPPAFPLYWLLDEPPAPPALSTAYHLPSIQRVFFSLAPSIQRVIFVFTGYPPKKIKYGKPRLGESTLTQIGLDTPNLTQPRLTFLYLELLGGVPVKKNTLYLKANIWSSSLTVSKSILIP